MGFEGGGEGIHRLYDERRGSSAWCYYQSSFILVSIYQVQYLIL